MEKEIWDKDKERQKMTGKYRFAYKSIFKPTTTAVRKSGGRTVTTKPTYKFNPNYKPKPRTTTSTRSKTNYKTSTKKTVKSVVTSWKKR